MLANEELEKLEHKYYDILTEILERSLGQIISQIYSQKSIIGAANTRVTNKIEAAVENVIESIIANQLHWNICSMSVSSDSCFECGDAIVHIDAKTVANTDGDNKNNKINVEASQTTYAKGTLLFISNKYWEPKLNLYENHVMFGPIPNLTYIVKVVYSEQNSVEKIKLVSLPHGQLQNTFGGAKILNAGRAKTHKNETKRRNIRFNEKEILKVQPWRVNTIYERK